MLVFIDMDGVVSDFDRHFIEVYGKPMVEMTNREKNRFWDAECVSRRFFANSPPIQEGLRLVEGILDLGVDVSFLTSTGGQLQHVEIAKQKLDFLQRVGLGHLPVAFATGTKSKASFSNANTILVDDRQKVVDAFRAGGGAAYMFWPATWTTVLEWVKAEVDAIQTR